MSSHLHWMIVRNTSSFIHKQRNIKKPFSKDPLNMAKLHSYHHSGTIRTRAVGIESAPNNKGFTVSIKKNFHRNKPVKMHSKSTINHHARKALSSVKNIFKSKYRRDLQMTGLRRASAILKSQRVHKKRKFTGSNRKKAD